MAYIPGSPAVVHLQMAFGADLTQDPSTWTWTEVTSYWEASQPVTVTDGRSEGATQAESLTATLTVKCTDGVLMPDQPESPYWPYVAEGTPVWMTVDAGAGAYSLIRGYISALALVWPGRSEVLAWTQLTIRGVLDRLGRGATPLRLPLERAILRDTPVEYWALAEKAGVIQASPGVAGGTPMAVSGTPQWEQLEGLPGFPGAYPVYKTSAGTLGILSAPVTMAATTVWAVEVQLHVTTIQTADAIVYPLGWSTTGSHPCWYMEYFWNDSASEEWISVQHKTYWGSGTSYGPTWVAPVGSFAGSWRNIRIVCQASGSDMITYLYVEGTLRDSRTSAGLAPGAVTGLTTSPPVAFGATPMTEYGVIQVGMAHLAVHRDATTDKHFAAHGFNGEAAANRVLRLCDEENVPCAIYSGTSAPMGVQTAAPLLDLLRECEAVDLGRLAELAFGLTYRPRSALYNQTPVLSLAAGQTADPYAPVRDLSRRRNEAQVTRTGGGTRTYLDAADQQQAGRLDDSASVNALSDDQLLPLAEWKVGLGTVGGMRYPSLSVDLGRHTDLMSAWQLLRLGDRVQAQPPVTPHPPGVLDQLVEGRTQTLLGRTEWTVTMVCSPARPYDVWVVEGEANAGRLDSGSHLEVYAGPASTMLSVTTNTGPVLATSAAYPADFPLDLEIGGEEVTCSGVYGTGDTSWRVAGLADHDDNASLTPGMPTGWQPGDLLVLLAAIRNSPVGYPETPTGWTLLGDAVNLRLFGRVARPGDTAPTVTFTGGAAGDSVSARIVAIPGATTRVLATAQALNAADQDVITPDLVAPTRSVVLMAMWKADDASAIAAPAALTLGYATWTSLGDDQSIAMAYKITTGTDTLMPSSFTVTGGGAAISRSLAVALACDSQAVAVARGVNGVTKDHYIGTPLRLWKPGQIAL